MLWLLVIILAYFLLSLTNLGDKYLLAGPPNPKNYSFYTGILGIAVLVLIPFINFVLPSLSQILLSLLAGSIFILALFSFYNSLENFEASRVIPAIGGILPLFTFSLVYVFSGGKETLTIDGLIALFLLILGSFFITFEKEKKISFKSLPISILTAFLFSLTFVLSKYVYLEQGFWPGFILMRIGGFLTSFCFLFFKEIRDEIFNPPVGGPTFQKKTGIIYLSNQILGAGAFILQNWAIALVPLGSLVFINALEGTKYLFLLILTAFLSLKFPSILKEKFSEKIILQKIISILLIGAGLIVLAI
jgi:hypothetical protein